VTQESLDVFEHASRCVSLAAIEAESIRRSRISRLPNPSAVRESASSTRSGYSSHCVGGGHLGFWLGIRGGHLAKRLGLDALFLLRDDGSRSRTATEGRLFSEEPAATTPFEGN
jgi:hypothetical protein